MFVLDVFMLRIGCISCPTNIDSLISGHGYQVRKETFCY